MTTPGPADHWHPVRPVVVRPRPLGVWWAKVPGPGRFATDGTICQVQEHAVYLAIRPKDDDVPGCKGNEGDRTIFVCAICSPPKET